MLRRLPANVFIATAALLVLAAPALAHDGGEGLYGETNDRVVTNAGFVLIVFYVGFIFLASVLQSQLEKRKYRRQAAAKARAETPNGW